MKPLSRMPRWELKAHFHHQVVSGTKQKLAPTSVPVSSHSSRWARLNGSIGVTGMVTQCLDLSHILCHLCTNSINKLWLMFYPKDGVYTISSSHHCLFPVSHPYTSLGRNLSRRHDILHSGIVRGASLYSIAPELSSFTCTAGKMITVHVLSFCVQCCPLICLVVCSHVLFPSVLWTPAPSHIFGGGAQHRVFGSWGSSLCSRAPGLPCFTHTADKVIAVHGQGFS